jgi:tetratricopeptide (TPR) repeat protein
VSDATQALSLDANDDMAYATRAAAFYFSKDYERAVADFTEALRVTPGDAKRYVARGWAYVGSLNIKSAAADADHAIKLGAPNARAYELRAHLYELVGQSDKAIADLRAALQAEPTREEIRTALRRLGATP